MTAGRLLLRSPPRQPLFPLDMLLWEGQRRLTLDVEVEPVEVVAALPDEESHVRVAEFDLEPEVECPGSEGSRAVETGIPIGECDRLEGHTSSADEGADFDLYCRLLRCPAEEKTCDRQELRVRVDPLVDRVFSRVTVAHPVVETGTIHGTRAHPTVGRRISPLKAVFVTSGRVPAGGASILTVSHQPRPSTT